MPHYQTDVTEEGLLPGQLTNISIYMVCTWQNVGSLYDQTIIVGQENIITNTLCKAFIQPTTLSFSQTYPIMAPV